MTDKTTRALVRAINLLRVWERLPRNETTIAQREWLRVRIYGGYWRGIRRSAPGVLRATLPCFECGRAVRGVRVEVCCVRGVWECIPRTSRGTGVQCVECWLREHESLSTKIYRDDDGRYVRAEYSNGQWRSWDVPGNDGTGRFGPSLRSLRRSGVRSYPTRGAALRQAARELARALGD